MAKKLSAAELRAEAELMLKKAQELEDAVAIKVGKMVLNLAKNGYKGFDLNAFAADVAALAK